MVGDLVHHLQDIAELQNCQVNSSIGHEAPTWNKLHLEEHFYKARAVTMGDHFVNMT